VGEAYRLAQCYQAALEQYQQCLQAVRRQTIVDPAFKIRVLLGLGLLYQDLGHIEAAQTHLTEAAEVATEVSNAQQLGLMYWTISERVAARGDYCGATSYAHKAAAVFDEGSRNHAICEVYRQLGTVCAHTGDVGRAYAYLEQAQTRAAIDQDPRAEAMVGCDLALMYLREKRIPAAEVAICRAHAAAKLCMDTVQQARCLFVLAQIQEGQDAPQNARSSYEEAITLLTDSQTTDSAELLQKVYASFSEHLERLGETNRAFAVLKRAYNARYSMARQGRTTEQMDATGTL